ncbi:hypothetical protein BpHYR1_053259 [Brachionus plicatilis]|uniref:Uncharacterized protein n=1 Tax=Brachionus plicatilis TaxID=10195 RepID=A0A3M7T152_BRAPC|nr:hypothetical protein BpHYR1_053259 [Brachionus plicatilis]
MLYRMLKNRLEDEEEIKISKSKYLKKFSFQKRIFKKLSLIFISSLKNIKSFDGMSRFKTRHDTKNLLSTLKKKIITIKPFFTFLHDFLSQKIILYPLKVSVMSIGAFLKLNSEILRTILMLLSLYQNNFGSTSLKKVINVFFNDCSGENQSKMFQT